MVSDNSVCSDCSLAPVKYRASFFPKTDEIFWMLETNFHKSLFGADSGTNLEQNFRRCYKVCSAIVHKNSFCPLNPETREEHKNKVRASQLQSQSKRSKEQLKLECVGN